MKSYDELKAEMETIQQQMAEAKKKERTNALKEVKRLCKEFGFTAGMLKGLRAQLLTAENLKRSNVYLPT
jgi:flagellar biosynthesis/type III secretory pathway protein FliH